MSIQTIPLSVPYEKAGLDAAGLHPTLTAVTLDFSKEIGRKQHSAVILCPGGGYEYCSDREAEPIAMRLAGYGIQAFVLRYSVVHKPFPTALLELAAAVSYVRSHAEDYDIHPDRIAVCGFSAGGHLAASLGVFWSSNLISGVFGDPAACRPNGLLLSYPVITAGQYQHAGSIDNIIGEDASPERRQLVSLEKQITPDVPPTFLWHCADDGLVPVQNSLLFLEGLSLAGVSYEAHIYPSGGHGLALADQTTAMGTWHLNPDCAGWFSLAVSWINRTLGTPALADA